MDGVASHGGQLVASMAASQLVRCQVEAAPAPHSVCLMYVAFVQSTCTSACAHHGRRALPLVSEFRSVFGTSHANLLSFSRDVSPHATCCCVPSLTLTVAEGCCRRHSLIAFPGSWLCYHYCCCYCCWWVLQLSQLTCHWCNVMVVMWAAVTLRSAVTGHFWSDNPAHVLCMAPYVVLRAAIRRAPWAGPDWMVSLDDDIILLTVSRPLTPFMYGYVLVWQ